MFITTQVSVLGAKLKPYRMTFWLTEFGTILYGSAYASLAFYADVLWARHTP